jgi:hypothetical protein
LEDSHWTAEITQAVLTQIDQLDTIWQRIVHK